MRRRAALPCKSQIVGQALVEYVVVTTLVGMALFLPIVGNESVAEQLARAVGNFFRGLSFIISVA